LDDSKADTVYIQYTLENTEGVIKNGQSRVDRNIEHTSYYLILSLVYATLRF